MSAPEVDGEGAQGGQEAFIPGGVALGGRMDGAGSGCDGRESTHPVSACRDACSSSSPADYESCVRACVEEILRRCRGGGPGAERIRYLKRKEFTGARAGT